MDRRVFDAMAEVEEAHWWFRARRRILEDRIRRLRLPGDARILEAGAGSGGNLAMLAKFGSVSAFERDDRARARAQARGIGRVAAVSLPDEIPFPGERFDLVVLLDVLEHLEDDRRSLEMLAPRLAPGGLMLLTVPARPKLWSRHDVLHHHHRRYAQSQLKAVIADAGLRLAEVTHFNTLLFPLVVAGRAWERFRNSERSVGLDVPTPPLNRALEATFASERLLLRRLDLPIGASLLAVAAAGPQRG